MPRRDRYDEDEDDDDYPRRRRSRRNDDDFSPIRMPGLAITAAVIWLVWALIIFCVFLLRLYTFVIQDNNVNGPCVLIDPVLFLGLAGWSGVAGLLTFVGRGWSLTFAGVFSLIFPLLFMFLEVIAAFFIGIELSQRRDQGRNDIPITMVFRSIILDSVLIAGVMLAGVFAMVSSKQYQRWTSFKQRR